MIVSITDFASFGSRQEVFAYEQQNPSDSWKIAISALRSLCSLDDQTGGGGGIVYLSNGDEPGIKRRKFF